MKTEAEAEAGPANGAAAGKPEAPHRPLNTAMPKRGFVAMWSDILADPKDFLQHAARQFAEDKCWRMASGLAYTTLLALVPLIAIAFSVLSAFPFFEGLRTDIQDVLFANLLPETAESVRGNFDRFIEKAETLGAVGLLVLFLTSILLLSTIEADLNRIFRATRKRPIAKRLVMFVGIIVLGPLAIGASFFIAAYVLVASEWLGLDTPLGFFGFLGPPMIIILALVLFYKGVPYRKVSFSAALVGATVAGIAFSLLRRGFGWYVSAFPSYEYVYGALAAVPIFLVWMYLSWTVILFGGVLTASIVEWRKIKAVKAQETETN